MDLLRVNGKDRVESSVEEVLREGIRELRSTKLGNGPGRVG